MTDAPNQITNAPPSCPIQCDLSREANLSPKIERLEARHTDAALAPGNLIVCSSIGHRCCPLNPAHSAHFGKHRKLRQPELRITMKRPRRRCFPAEVQCGNGGAKILAAEKLGKAVGRWVMQSPDGFFYMSGPLQRTAKVNCFRYVDTRMSKPTLRLIRPSPSALPS